MKVLYLSPHTDDLVCWSGATILNLVEKGHQVSQKVYCHKFPFGELKANCNNVSKALGINTEFFDYPVTKLHNYFCEITDQLFKLRESEKFDIVFIPCRQDWHPDHQVITKGAVSVFRESTIIGYIKKEIWDRKLDFKSPASVKQYAKKVELLKFYDLTPIDVGMSMSEWFEIIQVRHPIW